MDYYSDDCPIGRLPVECLLYTASFLPRRSKTNLAISCKSFMHWLLEDIWVDDAKEENDALFWGCKNGNLSVVDHAIASGAPVTTVQRRVVLRGFPNYLMKVPWLWDDVHREHFDISPLGYTIGGSASLPVITRLLESGVNPNVTGIWDMPPILMTLCAAHNGDVEWCPQEVIRLLLRFNAEVPQDDNRELRICTQLHQPRCHSDCALLIAEELLQRGMPPDTYDWFDEPPPLMLAIQNNPPSMQFIELLIKFGAGLNESEGDVDIADEDGYEYEYPRADILHETILQAHLHPETNPELYLDVLETLLSNGADPIRCALMSAVIQLAIQDKIPFLEKLALHGADFNTDDRDWPTALIAATYWPDGHIRRPQLDVMEWLLEKGADPNEVGVRAISPLYAAARSWSLPAVKLLLQHGAVDQHEDFDAKYNFKDMEDPPLSDELRERYAEWARARQ